MALSDKDTRVCDNEVSVIISETDFFSLPTAKSIRILLTSLKSLKSLASDSSIFSSFIMSSHLYEPVAGKRSASRLSHHSLGYPEKVEPPALQIDE